MIPRTMIPTGLIRNPRSAGNRRAPCSLTQLARGRGLAFAEPADTAELARTLAGWRDEGIALVAVDGGDGTVRDVVGALMALGWRPRLAVLPSGKINLVAGDVGWPRGGAEAALDLAEHAQGGWTAFTVARRTLLRLDRAGAPPAFGFFAGAAAFAAACRLANDRLHPRGLRGGAAVAAALAMTLAGAGRGRLLEGEAMTVCVDGAPPVGGRHFLLLATTLERLTLGLWPFWDEGGDRLVKLLDVKAPPRRLWRATLPLGRGRPRPWMRSCGYFSAGVGGVDLRLSSPVILDGEPFLPGADGRIRLSAGPVMEFVRP